MIWDPELCDLLFLLSSPIGNLSDISTRFLETLRHIDVLYCEDTRVTGSLLHKLEIKKILIRYDEHVEARLIPQIIAQIKSGQKIGVITDAGTPTLSDPGFKLVRECVKNNLKVVNIPGPSAITTALSVSGLPTDHFMFFGFLPKSEAHIQKVFDKMKKISEIQKISFVFFESPFRLLKTLEILSACIPTCSLAVCRELTKVHEEVIRGAPSDALKHFSSLPKIKGEITVVMNLS